MKITPGYRRRGPKAKSLSTGSRSRKRSGKQMTTLAKLAIELQVENRQMAAKLDQAAKQIDRLDAAVKRSAVGWVSWGKSVAVGIAGLAVVRGSMRGISQAFEKIDADGKKAQSIGMRSDEFAKLSHAADLAGVSTDELGVAFKKMSAVVSDASLGGKAAQDTLKQLGLAAEDISRDPAEALAQFADAIQAIQDPYRRAALAQDVFGRGAQTLMPLFEGGGLAIREASEEATRFNRAMSEFDRAKIEQANDSWSRMQAMIAGVTAELAVGLSPAVQVVAENVTALAGQWQSLVGSQSQATAEMQTQLTAFEAILGTIGDVGEAIWTGLRFAFNGVSWFFQQIAEGFADLLRQIETVTGPGSAGADAAEAFAKGWEEAIAEIDKVTQKNFMGKTFSERMAAAKEQAADTAAARMAAIDKLRAGGGGAGGGGAGVPQFGTLAGPAQAPLLGALSGVAAFTQSFENRNARSEADGKRFQMNVVGKLSAIVDLLENADDVAIADFQGGI